MEKVCHACLRAHKAGAAGASKGQEQPQLKLKDMGHQSHRCKDTGPQSHRGKGMGPQSYRCNDMGTSVTQIQPTSHMC